MAQGVTRGPVSATALKPRKRKPFLLDVYDTAVGKKYVMAVTGIIGVGYVVAHMIGNLKMYLGSEDLNHYGEWLRELLVPFFPRTVTLWLMRFLLIGALALHLHAAYALTVMNRRARPVGYKSSRDYVAANFASRTMRWTGIIVLLFVLFHLLDLTWGTTNPDYIAGDPYHNTVASFERIPVALVYVIANVALGVHLYHGAWSLFQSMGWVRPWRRQFAVVFTALIVLANISFPLAVVLGGIE